MADPTETPPSADELARRFLDLWQDQVAALSRDPETNSLIGKLLEGQVGAAGAILAATRVYGKSPSNDRTGAGAPRAAAAAASSRDRGGDVAELARRLDALEERLARLERPAGGARGKPRRKPRTPPA